VCCGGTPAGRMDVLGGKGGSVALMGAIVLGIGMRLAGSGGGSEVFGSGLNILTLWGTR
jgi:hypothetical protein